MPGHSATKNVVIISIIYKPELHKEYHAQTFLKCVETIPCLNYTEQELEKMHNL